MIEISEKDFLKGKYNTLIIDELAKNNLIIFPSESSYGFAGNALNKTVCDKIHSVNKEKKNKPIGIMIDCCEKIEQLVQLNKDKNLLERKFSYPLTILFRTKKQLPCTSNEFIGIRIPLNKTALQLCSLSDFPLTAPSANIHGNPTIFSPKEITKTFGKNNFVFINGGELEINAPSTYYHIEENKILRAGEISLQEIEKALKA